jgi:NAD(P)-dependent dehydrogenase (short-subunit alcohol dehydrogenase family)
MITAATGSKDVHEVAADFGSCAGIRRCAEQLQQRTPILHVLVNNAGVYMRHRRLTPDGMEMTFGVNHIGPFLLTALVLPLLQEAGAARVVTVSSAAHTRARLDFGNLQSEKSFDPYQAYALSKLGNVMFTLELAERLAGTGMTATTLHPGVIATKLLQEGFPGSTGEPVESGAARVVALACGAIPGDPNGQYFVNSVPREPSALARRKDLRARFWNVSALLAGEEPRP